MQVESLICLLFILIHLKKFKVSLCNIGWTAAFVANNANKMLNVKT